MGVANIVTLLTPLGTYQAKRTTDPGEATAFANVLPRTRANFDGLGTGAGGTFANDAAVAAAPSTGSGITGGVGPGTSTKELCAFSGSTASELDGLLFRFGGGHTDSGDGSFYTQSIDDGAASRLASGNGALWQLAKKSGRYLDANTHGRPAGSSQTTGTTPTGNNEVYWVTTNADGVMMPMVGHAYHCLAFWPGTHKVLVSNNFGFDPVAATSIGACWVYDIDTDTLTGPFTPTLLDVSDGLSTGTWGYAEQSNSSATGAPGAVIPWITDGTAYAVCAGTFGWFFVLITDPLNAGSGITFDVAPSNSAPQVPFENSNTPFGSQNSGVVLVDPAHAGDLIYFQHGINSSGVYDDTSFTLGRSLKGTVTAELAWHAYASGTITTQGAATALGHCVDTKRNVIVIWDGSAQLGIITPNASNTGWTISTQTITGGTGETPTVPTGTSGNNVPTIQYVPAADCYVLENAGLAFVVKPPNWLPAGGLPYPSSYQGLLLALWGWQGTQVTSDGAAPAESLATALTTVTGDSGIPLESAGTVSGDTATPDESAGRVTSDQPAPDEALATARSDAGAPVEFLATLRLDAPAPVEWSGTIRIDGAAPVEALVSAARDQGAPDEALGSAARDQGAPTEWTGAISVTMDAAAPVEWTATLRRDTSAPAEGLGTLRADGAAQAEWLASCLRDALAPVGYLTRLSGDAAGRVEFATSLTGDGTGRLEWSGTIARDQALPTGWTANLSARGAADIEWVGSLVVTSDAGLALEWQATVRRDGAPPVELVGAIPRVILVMRERLASPTVANESLGGAPTVANESLGASTIASESLE